MEQRVLVFVSALLMTVAAWGGERVTLAASDLYLPLTLPLLQPKRVKWGEPYLGGSVRIRVALARQDFQVESNFGSCDGLTPLRGITDEFSLDEKHFENEIREGFKMWSDYSSVQFEFVEDLNSADVVVGVSTTQSSIMHARVSLLVEDAPLRALGEIKRAAICLDQDEIWTLEKTHRVHKREKHLSLRLLIAHEVGHVLGFDHVDHKSELMVGKIVPTLTGLGVGDQAGVAELYGPPRVADIRR